MKEYILMADIIDSREKEPPELMESFRSLVEQANRNFEQNILSPLTITLGDEFQGVISGLAASVDVLVFLEEALIREQRTFKLRYVLHYGEIETPINPEIAYQMLGEGLTTARNILNEMKGSKARFRIAVDPEEKSELLQNAFVVYERIVDKWNTVRDYPLVASFLKYNDYKRVAEDLGKTRSLIWKREHSLQMESYFAIRNVLKLAAE